MINFIDMLMAGLEWTTGDRPSSRRTWKTWITTAPGSRRVITLGKCTSSPIPMVLRRMTVSWSPWCLMGCGSSPMSCCWMARPSRRSTSPIYPTTCPSPSMETGSQSFINLKVVMFSLLSLQLYLIYIILLLTYNILLYGLNKLMNFKSLFYMANFTNT